MLPTVPAAVAGIELVCPIAAIDVCPIAAIDVGVPIEIVVIVDGDVVISAPAASPAPSAAEGRAHHHSHTKRNRHSCGVVSRWWIGYGWVGIDRRAIDDRRVVTRNVYYLGVGLLDDDDLLGLDNFGFYLLLLAGFQIAFFLRLFAHALHRVHHVALLSQECVA